MLFLPLVLFKALGALFHHEKGGSFGRLGQYGDEVGVAAGGDELLRAVDPVTGKLAGIIHHRFGLGFERCQVAARLGFGYCVGHQALALGDGAQPFFFLGFGTADDDGIRTELDGEKGRAHAQADLAHFPGDDAAVHGAAAHAAVGFGDEKQLESDVGAQHLPDGGFGKNFIAVPFKDGFFGEQAIGQLVNGIDHHLPGLFVQTTLRTMGSGVGHVGFSFGEFNPRRWR